MGFFFFFINNVHNYIIEDVHFYKWGKEEEEGGEGSMLLFAVT